MQAPHARLRCGRGRDGGAADPAAPRLLVWLAQVLQRIATTLEGYSSVCAGPQRRYPAAHRRPQLEWYPSAWASHKRRPDKELHLATLLFARVVAQVLGLEALNEPWQYTPLDVLKVRAAAQRPQPSGLTWPLAPLGLVLAPPPPPLPFPPHFSFRFSLPPPWPLFSLPCPFISDSVQAFYWDAYWAVRAAAPHWLFVIQAPAPLGTSFEQLKAMRSVHCDIRAPRRIRFG